jgi:hypothetical protein
MTFLNYLSRDCASALAAAILIHLCAALPVHAASPPGEITQMSAGARHMCAVTHSGALYCWGDNENGQIGDGTLGDSKKFPVERIRRNPSLIFSSGATAVSTGYAHTCAVVSESVYCWGWNYSGQVDGKPSEKQVLKPSLVISGGVTAVAAAGMYTCAVVRGAALCWGASEYFTGQRQYLGDAPFKPTQVIASGVTALAARSENACAIVKGALKCWGGNRFNEITGANSNSFVGPTELIASGVTAVSLSGYEGGMSCAVANGALQCWGKKFVTAGANPAKLALPKPTTIIAQGVTGVSVLGTTGCAVVQAALQCWGYSSIGNFGYSENAPRIIPNPVTLVEGGVSAAGVGDGYICALVNGALRCRGYNAYGAISATVAMGNISDSRPFTSADGDTRVLSHVLADAMVAKEQLPQKITRFLQGKLIEHQQAVYFVRQANADYQGYDVSKPMSFNLDVTPLYPMSASSGPSADMVLAPDAPCGGKDLASRIDDNAFRVQKDKQFVALAQAFGAAFPDAPQWTGYDDLKPQRVSPADLQKLNACAKAIQDGWDSGPIESIAFGGIKIAPSLSRSWTVPGGGEHGADLSLSVTLKKGSKVDLSAQAQRVSLMVCDGLVLEGWKRGLSAPWKLRGEVLPDNAWVYFNTDESLVQSVDSPSFPAFTQTELLRAIHAEQGLAGLAPESATKACSPTIAGYQYTLRNGTQTVQTIFNPSGADTPEQGCDQQLPTIALRAADHVGALRGQQLHTAICKPWPGDASKTLVALLRAQPGNNDDMKTYDLDVFIVNTTSAAILQHIAQPGAVTSDAMRFEGIAFDTANYALAPGRRAFGLRTKHNHNGATSIYYETLYLYLPQGKSLKPVLNGLFTSQSSSSNAGGDCYEARHSARSIAIGKNRNNGLTDLVVTDRSSEQEVKTTRNGCVEKVNKSTSQQVLVFDGEAYMVPGALNQ